MTLIEKENNKNTALVRPMSDQSYEEGDIAPTIRNGDKGEVRICVASRGRNTENPSDRTAGNSTEQRLEPNSQGTTNTLTGVQKDNLIATITDDHFKSQNSLDYSVTAPTIKHNSGALKVNKIRRLTEIECERLQGFKDNWTEFGNYDGVVKKIPKTQRYKLCGNAVTTAVVKAIASKLNFNL